MDEKTRGKYLDDHAALWLRYKTVSDENKHLVQANARLREALAPFAEAWNDNRNHDIALAVPSRHTVSEDDWKRAAEVLKETEPL